MVINIIISYDYPNGDSSVTIHRVNSCKMVGSVELDKYEEIKKEYPDRIVELIRTPDKWIGKHDLFWGEKNIKIDTLKSTNGPSVNYIKFDVLVQINDHEGYCSGSECEYSEYRDTVICDLNQPRYNLLILREEDISIDDYGYFMCEIEDNVKRRAKPVQSGYCNNSEEADLHGLSPHEDRITIISGIKK